MNGKQLKNSILQWAIQGKLVPQDPNDEPASVLLERIRAEKAQLIKEGKIKKDKNETIIFRGDDNSHYEKLPNGEVRCIDDEIPFEIPATWCWVRLRNYAEIIGGYAFPSTELKTDKGLRVIRISDISEEGFVNKSIVRYNAPNSLDNYKIAVDDILIAMTGGTVGKSLYVQSLSEDMLLNQRVAIIRNKWFEVKYIDCVIKSPHIKEFINSRKNSTNDNISMVDIANFLIPIPPLSEQKRIIDKYQEILPSIDKYNECQEKLDTLNATLYTNLKKSILQEAIQGKLVEQCDTEEPASKLLARISEEKKKLLKEGRLIKKDLVESTIYRGDDNKYYEQIGGKAIEVDSDFDFPNTWKVVRLADICRLIDGEKKKGKYVCLDAKYLRGKSSGDVLNEGKFIVKGDNIILVDGENSGEVFTVPCEGYMGSTFKQLWVSSEMYLPYVLYFIQFYKDRLRNSKKGAAIPHLNKEIFYNLLIGIPPKEEQMRISSKVADLYSNL